ncbi:MAG: helix-turn-helix domain-containing protein [Prevotellaceae bacterium]|nr:helix-turn-helix domain-containing protein [Prevotellaceae bacterium]
MDIGTKIRKLREAKILSQNDLALKLGISKPLFII